MTTPVGPAAAQVMTVFRSRASSRRGGGVRRARHYEEYSIAVGTVDHASAWVRAAR